MKKEHKYFAINLNLITFKELGEAINHWVKKEKRDFTIVNSKIHIIRSGDKTLMMYLKPKIEKPKDGANPEHKES